MKKLLSKLIGKALLAAVVVYCSLPFQDFLKGLTFQLEVIGKKPTLIISGFLIVISLYIIFIMNRKYLNMAKFRSTIKQGAYLDIMKYIFFSLLAILTCAAALAVAMEGLTYILEFY